MNKVLILFGKTPLNKKRPFANKDHQCCYEYFYSLCAKENIQMYRASYCLEINEKYKTRLNL
ncbi:MAG: Uncharacterized protein Athens071425_188 [Parcubacteria group bacterium Athens0714_25]|nr:MAG: Uncharacterized protein Athens071425_188 [Parcubacteria group bacterium Athens0714_25]